MTPPSRRQHPTVSDVALALATRRSDPLSKVSLVLNAKGDVQIEVEKIPDVLHVPAQAVFNKNGKYTVFVQGKDGKFAAREVQLIKQSESMMVLKGGVQPGEIIAMADPTAKKNDCVLHNG